jgi:hypothetical protein
MASELRIAKPRVLKNGSESTAVVRRTMAEVIRIGRKMWPEIQNRWTRLEWNAVCRKMADDLAAEAAAAYAKTFVTTLFIKRVKCNEKAFDNFEGAEEQANAWIAQYDNASATIEARP